MRRLLYSLIACLPLAAAGAGVLAAEAPAATANLATGSAAPVWRMTQASPWRLTDGDQPLDATGIGAQPMGLRGSGALVAGNRERTSGGIAYVINPSVAAHALVSQESWSVPMLTVGCTVGDSNCERAVAAPQIIDSRLGATFYGDGYSVDLDLGKTRSNANSAALPRIVPDSVLDTTISGLPAYSVSGGTSLRARSRWTLGAESGVEVGASVGRIRLLPGNVLGVSSLDQKSLSLGVNRGALSGRVVGRMMESGAGTSALAGDNHWSSVDLGVTWRLPWQGALSFGAQNVWTSGHAAALGGARDPDQSRTPYVQYHQDF